LFWIIVTEFFLTYTNLVKIIVFTLFYLTCIEKELWIIYYFIKCPSCFITTTKATKTTYPPNIQIFGLNTERNIVIVSTIHLLTFQNHLTRRFVPMKDRLGYPLLPCVEYLSNCHHKGPHWLFLRVRSIINLNMKLLSNWIENSLL
jgi:hypothetical protein